MTQFQDKHKEYFYDMPIDLCCIINPADHKILQSNSTFESTLGWKSTDIIGQILDGFTHTDTDKTAIEKAFSKLTLGIHSFSFETAFRAKNNLLRQIEWKCYLEDENQWVFAIGRDITQHKEAQKTLAQQSHLDPLTNIATRQTFLTMLETELPGAIRYHYATSVILIEIDHFSEYSAMHGAQKSDELIKQTTAALKTFLRRKTDFFARFDNNQFAILLSHNDAEKALKTAEYLRVNVENLTSQGGGAHKGVTLSLGVSAIPETQEKEIKLDQLLNAAKRALTVSLQSGGNQVGFANDF